jgi:hypothetical protein
MSRCHEYHTNILLYPDNELSAVRNSRIPADI